MLLYGFIGIEYLYYFFEGKGGMGIIFVFFIFIFVLLEKKIRYNLVEFILNIRWRVWEWLFISREDDEYEKKCY